MEQPKRRAKAKRAIEDAEQNPADGPTPSPAKQMRRHSDTSGLRRGNDVSRPIEIDADTVSVEDNYPQHNSKNPSLNPRLGDAVNPRKSLADKNSSSSAGNRTDQAPKSKTSRDRYKTRALLPLCPAGDSVGSSVAQNRDRDRKVQASAALRRANLPATPGSTYSEYGQARHLSRQSRLDLGIPESVPVLPGSPVRGNAFHPGQDYRAAGSRMEPMNEHVTVQSMPSGQISGYGQPEIHERPAVVVRGQPKAYHQHFYSPSSLTLDSRQMGPPSRPYHMNRYPERCLPGRQGNVLDLHNTISNQPFSTNPQMSRAPDRGARQLHTQAPDPVNAAVFQRGSYNGFGQQDPALALHGYGSTFERSDQQQIPAQRAFAPQMTAPFQSNGYYQQPTHNAMQPSTFDGYNQHPAQDAMPFATPNEYTPQHTHSATPPSTSNGYDQQHTQNAMPLMTANGYNQQRMHNETPLPPHWEVPFHYHAPQQQQTGPAMPGSGQDDFSFDPFLGVATNDNSSRAPMPTYGDLENWVGPPLPDLDPSF
ncbi:hypothetical protein DDE82_003947 [Stemphylium lycopersici]|nr:hypothetical protein TW65_71806 [Stemphylium lycopersici]RAR05480.1 hypothetical protein DDE82_003947 [Stemphylium lycopersici]